MIDTPPPTPRADSAAPPPDPPAPEPPADTQRTAASERRRVPANARVVDALASGRSYHERQRDLVHASLITPW